MQGESKIARAVDCSGVAMDRTALWAG